MFFFKVVIGAKDIAPEDVRVTLKNLDPETYEDLFPLPVHRSEDPRENPCENPVFKHVVQNSVSLYSYNYVTK